VNIPYYKAALIDPAFLRKAVRRLVKVMHAEFPQVETIAVQGTSGSSVAYPVSFVSGLKVCYVRKVSEHSASHGNEIENHPCDKPYVIIDDFISSGDTINRIRNRIKGNCVGVIEYIASVDNEYSKIPSIRHEKIQDAHKWVDFPFEAILIQIPRTSY